MKIGKPIDAGPPVPGTRPADAASTRADGPVPGAASTAGPAPSATVIASETARLAETARALGADGDAQVRTETVAALRKAIDEGQYRVNAKKVADRMIKEAAELLQSIATPGK